MELGDVRGDVSKVLYRGPELFKALWMTILSWTPTPIVMLPQQRVALMSKVFPL